jgi:hypothetical protein
MSYQEQYERLQALRAQTRALEKQVERQARSMQPLTLDDERQMQSMQAKADEAYQTARRRAPPPLGHERPDEYRLRLVEGVKRYSPRWKSVDLSRTGAVAGALDIAETQIFDDARKYGRTADLKPGEIRERPITTPAGTRVIEFDGGEGAHFTQQFASPVWKVKRMPSVEECHAMTRNNLLSRLTELVPSWARTLVGAPRSAF